MHYAEGGGGTFHEGGKPWGVDFGPYVVDGRRGEGKVLSNLEPLLYFAPCSKAATKPGKDFVQTGEANSCCFAVDGNVR